MPTSYIKTSPSVTLCGIDIEKGTVKARQSLERHLPCSSLCCQERNSITTPPPPPPPRRNAWLSLRICPPTMFFHAFQINFPSTPKYMVLSRVQKISEQKPPAVLLYLIATHPVHHLHSICAIYCLALFTSLVITRTQNRHATSLSQAHLKIDDILVWKTSSDFIIVSINIHSTQRLALSLTTGYSAVLRTCRERTLRNKTRRSFRVSYFIFYDIIC